VDDTTCLLGGFLAAVIGLVAGYGVGFTIGHMRGYGIRLEDIEMRAKQRITAQDILDRNNRRGERREGGE
jgi:hypothetical protein